MVRFLEKNEYASTIPLFIECFGDDPEFMEEYYGTVNADGAVQGRIRNGHVAVLKKEGKILSMVHIRYYDAELFFGSGSLHLQVPYLMGICTDPACRHRGYMDQVMAFVLDQMMYEGHPWCFLIPVDKEIYRHLDFIYEWKLTEEEQEMLYADEGLDTALARLLNAERFPEGEIRIRKELS